MDSDVLAEVAGVLVADVVAELDNVVDVVPVVLVVGVVVDDDVRVVVAVDVAVEENVVVTDERHSRSSSGSGGGTCRGRWCRGLGARHSAGWCCHARI